MLVSRPHAAVDQVFDGRCRVSKPENQTREHRFSFASHILGRLLFRSIYKRSRHSEQISGDPP
jgi:hypothetical protein